MDITTVKLDPKIWYCGQYNSLLLSINMDERYQCCLGIMATQLGVPDSMLLDKGTLASLSPNALQILPSGISKIQGQKWDILYSINDDQTSMSLQARVNYLNAECLKEEIPLRFTLKD